MSTPCTPDEKHVSAWIPAGILFGLILGGLAGALVFTLAFPTLDGLFIQPFNMGSVTLPDLTHAPALWIALGLSALLIAAVAVMPTRPGRSRP